MSESDVVRLRPYRIRLVSWISAATLLIVFSLIATSLYGPTGQGPGVFQRGDQAAMVGLGVLAALGCLVFTRPRVEADARGLRVRNLLGSYELPWEVVRAVRFGRGSPWASLELHDDDVLPMLAVQAADKERAVAGVRALRALHARHLARPAAPASPAGETAPRPPTDGPAAG